MPLLKPAKNHMAYLKMGIFGDTGSGKTWTATQVALGLHRHIQSKAPIAFFDTETGANFMIPKFKEAGIELMTVNSSSLKDLTQTFAEVEEAGIPILIIDSITNIWDEFTESYRKKKKQSFIELWDWKPIKDDWRRNFRDKFVNTKAHVIMCGREGNIYQTVEQNKGGHVKKETIKAGTKMRAEGDTGYEPSLLVEMEKVFLDGKGKYARRANVIKDRFGVVDSKSFDNPTFKDFLPHITLLNLGGEHQGIEVDRTSTEMFEDPDYSTMEWRRQKEIALEELQNLLVKSGLDGTKSDVKMHRIKMLEVAYGTASKTAIERLSVEEIKAGMVTIGLALEEEKQDRIAKEEADIKAHKEAEKAKKSKDTMSDVKATAERIKQKQKA